jgi:hypothetical protein
MIAHLKEHFKTYGMQGKSYKYIDVASYILPSINAPSAAISGLVNLTTDVTYLSVDKEPHRKQSHMCNENSNALRYNNCKPTIMKQRACKSEGTNHCPPRWNSKMATLFHGEEGREAFFDPMYVRFCCYNRRGGTGQVHAMEIWKSKSLMINTTVHSNRRFTPHVKSLDFYNQSDVLDMKTVCTLQPRDVKNPSKNDKSNSELRNFQVTAKFGIVDYSDLLIMGDVGYSYKFEFSCPNAKTKRIIKLPVDIQIAPCEMGQQLDPGRQCKQCKPGEYSPKGIVCLPCPTGGHCSKDILKSDGSRITVGTSFPEAESGYWLHEAPRSLIDGNLDAGINADFWNIAVADHTGNRHTPFYTPASKRQVRSQTVHCDWSQELCSPGQYYDHNMGCKQLSGKTATQIFNCVSGMHFYRCPLEHHSCSYTKYTKESGAEKVGSHPTLLRHIALGAEKATAMSDIWGTSAPCANLDTIKEATTRAKNAWT